LRPRPLAPGPRRRRFCTPFSHVARYVRPLVQPRSACVVDAVYLLILAALYAVSHALIWALERLGRSS